jgi:hypothetical protein
MPASCCRAGSRSGENPKKMESTRPVPKQVRQVRQCCPQWRRVRQLINTNCRSGASVFIPASRRDRIRLVVRGI